MINVFKYKNLKECLSKKIFVYSCIFLIVGVFVLPISIYFSTEITYFLTEKIQNESATFFETLENNVNEDIIESYKNKNVSEKMQSNLIKWVTYFDNIKDRLFDNTIKLISSYLINMVVFPILVFIFCYLPVKTLFVIFYNKIVYNRSF